MFRRSLIGVAFLAGLAMGQPVAAGPLSLYDFVVFSAGGCRPATPCALARYNSQTNYETQIDGNNVINGIIGSNQDLHIIGSTQINGSVYVGGYFDMGTDAVIGSSSSIQQVVVNGVNPTVAGAGS